MAISFTQTRTIPRPSKIKQYLTGFFISYLLIIPQSLNGLRTTPLSGNSADIGLQMARAADSPPDKNVDQISQKMIDKRVTIELLKLPSPESSLGSKPGPGKQIKVGYTLRLSGSVKSEAEKAQATSAALDAATAVLGEPLARQQFRQVLETTLINWIEIDPEAPSLEDAAKDNQVKKLKTAVETTLDDPRMTVTVRAIDPAVDGGKTLYVASVEGTVRTDDEAKFTRRAACIGLGGTPGANGACGLGADKTLEFIGLEAGALNPTGPSRADAKKAAQAKKDAENPDDPPTTAIWPLMFGPDQVSSTLGQSNLTEQADRYKIDALVSMLNATYGKSATDGPVQAGRRSLLLKGPESQLLKIKHDLALLDAPGPQVQLDVWVLQASGNQAAVADIEKQANWRLYIARQQMKWLTDELGLIVGKYGTLYGVDVTNQDNFKFFDSTGRNSSSYVDAAHRATNSKELNQLVKKLSVVGGKTLTPGRCLPLIHSLMYLALATDANNTVGYTSLIDGSWTGPQQRMLQELQIFAFKIKLLGDLLGQHPPAQWDDNEDLTLGRFPVNINADPTVLQRISELMEVSKLEDPTWLPAGGDYQTVFREGVKNGIFLPNFTRAFRRLDQENTASLTYYQDSLKSFLDALGDFRAIESNGVLKQYQKTAARYHQSDPRIDSKIAQARAKLWAAPERLTNRASALDRLLGDAVDAYATDVQNLFLEPLVTDLQKVNSSGSKLGGVALLGRTRIVVTSGLQAGMVPTLGASVNSTVPAPMSASDLTGLLGSTGLAGVLPNLSNPQVALLGSLLNQTPPAYTRIAPGIGLNIRPTVMADSSSARLQIDANFGVTTSFPDKQTDRADIIQPEPFNTVQSHHILTDAIMGSFDLFGLSSFDVDTRVPQGPYVVPVLGRFPVLGKMLQFPRKDKAITHHSIILANAVILPRSLDIVHFAGVDSTDGN